MKKFILSIGLLLCVQNPIFAAQESIQENREEEIVVEAEDVEEVKQPLQTKSSRGNKTDKKDNNKKLMVGTALGFAGLSGAAFTAYLLRTRVSPSEVEFGSDKFRDSKEVEDGFNKWFHLQSWHIGGWCEYGKKYELIVPYIQRVKIPSGQKSPIIFIGDLHGCKLPLNRILNKLQLLGYLDADGELLRGAYLVFFGDYCTRGKHEEYVLSRVLQLKIKNPQHVIALKGNMDAGKEITNKFPSAAYFHFEESDVLVQCAHAGFNQNLSHKDIMAFVMDKYDYLKIEDDNGYLNTHFENKSQKLFDARFPQDQKTCFIRGHDHSTFGCKVYDRLSDESVSGATKRGKRDKYKVLMDFKTTTFVDEAIGAESRDGYTRRVISECTRHQYPIYTLSAAAGASGKTTDECDVDLEKECFAIFNLNPLQGDQGDRKSFLEIYEKD